MDVLALPWRGPIDRELFEEAAASSGRSIHVVPSVHVLLRDAAAIRRELPKLMIVDSTWAPALTEALNNGLAFLAAIPTILLQFVPTPDTDLLARQTSVIAVVSPNEEFSSHLPELISAFFGLGENHNPEAAKPTAYDALAQSILDQPPRDPTFFRRAVRRQLLRQGVRDATL